MGNLQSNNADFCWPLCYVFLFNTAIHLDYVCSLQAPLLIGCDVRNMTKETMEIVSNEEVIAVNQGVNFLEFLSNKLIVGESHNMS